MDELRDGPLMGLSLLAMATLLLLAFLFEQDAS